MKKFNRKTFLELSKMTTEECLKYYYRFKNYYIEHDLFGKNIKLNNILHKPKLFLIKILRIIDGDKLELFAKADENNLGLKRVNKLKIDNSQPIIIAFNHICYSDVERVSEAIGLNYSVVMGDPEHTFGRFPEHLFASISNGIYINNEDKDDSAFTIKIIQEQIENNKQNILWAPEGIWCVTSENQLLYPLYDGVSAVSLSTNTKILPVAIDKDKNIFRVAIGDFISPKELKNMPLKKRRKILYLTSRLRDELASLKYELIKIKTERISNGNEYIKRKLISEEEVREIFKVNPETFHEDKIINGMKYYSYERLEFQIENNEILSRYVDKEKNIIFTDEKIEKRKRKLPDIKEEYKEKFKHLFKI